MDSCRALSTTAVCPATAMLRRFFTSWLQQKHGGQEPIKGQLVVLKHRHAKDLFFFLSIFAPCAPNNDCCGGALSLICMLQGQKPKTTTEYSRLNHPSCRNFKRSKKWRKACVSIPSRKVLQLVRWLILGTLSHDETERAIFLGAPASNKLDLRAATIGLR